MYPSLRISSHFGPATLNVEILPQKHFRYYEHVPLYAYTLEWRMETLRTIAARHTRLELTSCSTCAKELKIKYPLDPDQEEYQWFSQFPSRFHRQFIIDGQDGKQAHYRRIFVCSDSCLTAFNATVDQNMHEVFDVPIKPVELDDYDDRGVVACSITPSLATDPSAEMAHGGLGAALDEEDREAIMECEMDEDLRQVLLHPEAPIQFNEWTEVSRKGRKQRR